MGKKPVEQKELRFPARNGATQTGQVMKLPEHAGKGRFTALVWAGDNQYTFLAFQVKVIANDRRVFANEFMGQS